MKQAVTHGRQTGEEWYYSSDQTGLAKQIISYFLVGGLPGFTLPALFPFLFVDSLFYGFLFWNFLPNLPLFPFTSVFAPFSRSHQAVIFVLGAKVTSGSDGKARSSLLFCVEISTPAQASGSISAKNLAFPNPYLFRHPKRKRPMRQKDALKKMSDKREADKIVWNSTPSALESALKNKKSKTKRIWERQ